MAGYHVPSFTIYHPSFTSREYMTLDWTNATGGISIMGKIINISGVKESLTETLYGLQELTSCVVTLDDSDGAFKSLFDTYELRRAKCKIAWRALPAGTEFHIRYYSLDSVEFSSERAKVNLVSQTEELWKETYPKDVISTSLFYKDGLPSLDAGKPIPICLGENIPRAPLGLIRSNTADDIYDYLISYGTIGGVDETYQKIGDLEYEGLPITSGTATSYGEDQLVDSNATFMTDGIVAGDRVFDTSHSSSTTVKTDPTVETILELNSNIFVGSENYDIKLQFTVYDGSQDFSTATPSSTTLYKLIDTVGGRNFNTDGVTKWDIVSNTTAGTWAFVKAVDSNTQLALMDASGADKHIFTNTTDTYHVAPHRWDYDTGESGLAFIRFKTEMKDSSQTYFELFADVDGIEDSGTVITSPADQFRHFISNSQWGMGLSVDTTSFNAVETALNAASITVGATHSFAEKMTAIDIRRQFNLLCRFAWLDYYNDIYYCYIDGGYDATSVMSFDEHEIIVEKFYEHGSKDFVRAIKVYCQKADAYQGSYEVLTYVNATATWGVIKEYTVFSTTNLTTADKIGVWIRKRHRYQDKKILFKTTDNKAIATNVKLGATIDITHSALGLSGDLYEILSIERNPNFIRILAGEYNNNLY
jgi:hypothetical protein